MLSHALNVLFLASGPSCAAALADCFGVWKVEYLAAPADCGGGFLLGLYGGGLGGGAHSEP